MAEEKRGDERLNWDDFFFLLTLIYSSRGSCDRLRVACILVKDNKIVGAGYNGSVRGMPSCDEVGHKIIEDHCGRTIHSEKNAIYNAVANLKGATAYINATPCIDCVKGLLQKGVATIVYVGSYANSRGADEIQTLCGEGQRINIVQANDDPAYLVELLKRAINRLRGPGGMFQGLYDDLFDFRRHDDQPMRLC